MKINNYISSVNLSEASTTMKENTVKKIRLNELFHLNTEHPTEELAGVCIDGVHYYDFKNVQFINNTGMASLIDLSKCLLEQGIKVQFVNVNEKIKNKIKSIGLENILNCS
jgi:anti-anti-sigma regulatory factor